MRNPKLIGERAECSFMLQALSRGLAVSKPFGESCAYDAIVDNGRRLLRVQVRSTWVCGSHDRFHVNASRCKDRRGYTEADIEFMAVWIVPRDTWYIIPTRALDAKRLAFRPQIAKSRGRWEKYKEAWHLLMSGD